MDNQAHTPPPGKTFDAGENPRQSEPAVEAGYNAAAAQTSRDARVAEPRVANDGQLVEAGYGHGV